MDIIKKQDQTALTIEITGRLDTTTAPQLEDVVKADLDGITELLLDLAGLEYISSAGLRVVLSAQKIMNKQGNMKIVNANESIMEVFEITGFADILTFA